METKSKNRKNSKLAAVPKESQKVPPRNSQSQEAAFHRINEDYKTQVSEEIEVRLTKRLYQQLLGQKVESLVHCQSYLSFFASSSSGTTRNLLERIPES